MASVSVFFMHRLQACYGRIKRYVLNHKMIHKVVPVKELQHAVVVSQHERSAKKFFQDHLPKGMGFYSKKLHSEEEAERRAVVASGCRVKKAFDLQAFAIEAPAEETTEKT